MALSPPELVQDHLNLDAPTMAALSKDKPVIVGPRSASCSSVRLRQRRCCSPTSPSVGSSSLSEVGSRSLSLGQAKYGRSAYAGRRRLPYHAYGCSGDRRVVISSWPPG